MIIYKIYLFHYLADARAERLQMDSQGMPRMVTRFESDGAKLREGRMPEEHWNMLSEARTEVDSQLESNAPFLLYGKVCRQRRSIGFFADPSITYGYFYSGVVAKSKLPGEAMKRLLEYINEFFGSRFNAVLVNCYKNGDDYISDHSDNEAGLDAKAGVVIVSAGGERTMHFKRAKNASSGAMAFLKGPFKVELKNGSVVAMQGPEFQRSYTHGIPPEKTRNQPRWSFTFRHHVPGIDESDKIASAKKTMEKIDAIEARKAAIKEVEAEEGPSAKRAKLK